MLRSRCLPPSPRSPPSSKLCQFYVPASPVSRAEICKPCPVAIVPTLGCPRPVPPSLLLRASALSGNIIPGVCFCSSKNSPYIRTRLVTPQEKNKHNGSTTLTDTFAPASTSGRPSRGRAQPVYPCLHHAHAATSRSGAETAQGGAPPNPTLIRSHVYCCY